MSDVVIDDIIPRTQLTATAGQTVFNTNWTVDATTDVVVYARAAGVEPDDFTQVVSTSAYNVTLIGATQTVRVTFLSGRTLNDIITIVRNTPAERLNLYINTNLTASMLNEDFGILTLVDQQAQMYDTAVAPHYNLSAILDPVTIAGGGDIILPVLGAKQGWRKNSDDTEIEVYNLPDGGLSPATATYLIKTAVAALPNAQVMGQLPSGYTANTASSGVQVSRVLNGTTNQIDVSNPDGTGGDPVWKLSNILNTPGTFNIDSSTAVDEIIDDDTLATATHSNLATALAIKTYVDNHSGGSGIVDTIVATANQIDVDSTDPANPIVSLSTTINTPGTFTIEGTIVLDSIIDDDTFATATDTNIPTSESVKAYVDSHSGGVTEVQVQQSAFNYGVDSGAADSYQVTLNPAVSSYTAGLPVSFIPNTINATTTPTLNINGVGPAPIVLAGGGAVSPGDLDATFPAFVIYSSFFGFTLLNPAVSYAKANLVQHNFYNNGPDSGVADAYIVTLQIPLVGSYYDGMPVTFMPNNTNLTTTPTLDVVGGGGPQTIYRPGLQPLQAGDIVALEVVYVFADVFNSAWIILNPANPPLSTGFTTVNIQNFLTSGTYTPTAGMKYCTVYAIGAGGAGGGADGSAGQFAFGGSGGAGSLSILNASAATIGASQAVTIGAGGTGVSNGTGNAGADSSLGALCIGIGGGGGNAGTSVAGATTAQGGAGGIAGTGDITSVGNAGGYAAVLSGVNGIALPGLGGGTMLGGAQAGSAAADNTGAGGGGVGSYNGGGAAAGAAGGSGIVWIIEYI